MQKKKNNNVLPEISKKGFYYYYFVSATCLNIVSSKEQNYVEIILNEDTIFALNLMQYLNIFFR